MSNGGWDSLTTRGGKKGHRRGGLRTLKLPRGLPGKKVAKTLSKNGFYVKRQPSTHLIMRRDNPHPQVVVPLHKSIDTGTLSSIIDGADLTTEEYIKLLK